jgi:CheY-like chemotaxis protein
MEKIDISNIFEQCHSMVSPLALKNNITLNIEKQIDGYVIADYTRLKQVMLNLLSNAIKYNKNHGTITLNAIQKEYNITRISITDTGIGVPEKYIDEIFQPFNRLSADSTIEGTGIGLSISKQLIERMDGSIGVKSKFGEGSVFWIELSGDLKTGTTEEHKVNSSEQLTMNTSTQNITHILVAEDNPTNQALILTQLKTLGYHADIVSNGEEALDKLADHTYDLLITDCNMPIIDGYTLVKTIREGGNNILPVIAITADAFPEKKVKCLELGVNEQLIKPVDLSTLKQAIENSLH